MISFEPLAASGMIKFFAEKTHGQGFVMKEFARADYKGLLFAVDLSIELNLIGFFHNEP